MALHPPTALRRLRRLFGCICICYCGNAQWQSRSKQWAKWTRPWTTAGVDIPDAAASRWAAGGPTTSLGWGGWWFWDPVENASFMPWLVGTALIHSLAVAEKRGLFKSWTLLLAIAAFSLSLLGTFLVRSGIIVSVHAFATDPARGIFILVIPRHRRPHSGCCWRCTPGEPQALDSDAGFKPNSRETYLAVKQCATCHSGDRIVFYWDAWRRSCYEVAGTWAKFPLDAPWFNIACSCIPMLPLVLS